MRILYIDVDSLRPDHLGCYGYPRNTSPNIDRLAAEGIRFDECYTSDSPCLPSRTALASGRFGIHNGAVNHGGVAADPLPLGPYRTFNTHPDYRSWFQTLQEAGIYTASISSFPQRHGAWWFNSGLREWLNPAKNGDERADEVNEPAVSWLQARAGEDDWFLHVNYWDPHTTYRTPPEYGNQFENEPAPAWLTEELLQRHRNSFGPMSAQDTSLSWFGWRSPLPWVPDQIASLGDFKHWIDAYDTGIRYMDEHLGRLLAVLEEQGVLDETMIVLSADHGENQGELNVYGDHQTADMITARVPLIIRWPQQLEAGRVDRSFHYQLDLAASILELLGIETPGGWDSKSFAANLTGSGSQGSGSQGREYLVLSQMAWSCQRSVRFDNWLLIRTYDAGFKDFPDTMLFDVVEDPHEINNLAEVHPEIVQRGLALLQRWHDEMMNTSLHAVDPLQTVLREGGPFHLRGELESYMKRLEETGREDHARHIADQASRRDRN